DRCGLPQRSIRKRSAGSGVWPLGHVRSLKFNERDMCQQRTRYASNRPDPKMNGRTSDLQPEANLTLAILSRSTHDRATELKRADAHAPHFTAAAGPAHQGRGFVSRARRLSPGGETSRNVR